MSPLEEMQQAQVNRSIRTIKAELEYLCDASIISPQTLSDLLSRIPAQTALHAPISVGALPPESQNNASAVPIQPINGLNLNHNRANSNYGQNEKENYGQNEKQDYPHPAASPQPPPPAYSNAPPPPQAQWPPLAQATALYAYTSTDEGDLELQPNDHVTVTEYMNAEWWKGRSSRTGQEGIFPRSYVRVIEEKSGPTANTANGTNYGNMPLETSGMGNGEGKVPGKAEQQVSCRALCDVVGQDANTDCLLGQEVWQETGQRRHLRCGRYDWRQYREQYLLVTSNDEHIIFWALKESRMRRCMGRCSWLAPRAKFFG